MCEVALGISIVALITAAVGLFFAFGAHDRMDAAPPQDRESGG
jgi:hypothetical protein